MRIYESVKDLPQTAGKYKVRVPVTIDVNGSDVVIWTHALVGATEGPTLTLLAGLHGNEWLHLHFFLRLIEAFERGDIETARLQQWRAAEFLTIFRRMRLGVDGHKAMMKLIGIDCGPCRLPVVPLAADRERELENALREIGFFDWIA